MAKQSASQASLRPPALITRAEVAQWIEQWLRREIDDAALARWAFDCFYAIELETSALEEGAETQVASALDELMFGDEPAFRLSEEELRALAERLTATG